MWTVSSIPSTIWNRKFVGNLDKIYCYTLKQGTSGVGFAPLCDELTVSQIVLHVERKTKPQKFTCIDWLVCRVFFSKWRQKVFLTHSTGPRVSADYQNICVRCFLSSKFFWFYFHVVRSTFSWEKKGTKKKHCSLICHLLRKIPLRPKMAPETKQ